MWKMYTRYRVNIVYIDVISCLHRRHRQHRDVNDVYTISCQHRLHRYTIMLTLLTSSISRCERCIHNIVSTSFTSMYYRVNIVHIVDIVIYEMNGNFGLFCLFVVGRDVLSLSVPQSVLRKRRFTYQILLRPARFVCVFLWRYNICTSFRADFWLRRTTSWTFIVIRANIMYQYRWFNKAIVYFYFAMSTM